MSDTLQAAGAGVAAVVVSLVGVEPQVLLFAAVGCALNMPATKKAGRARAVLMFLCTVFASSLLGTIAANEVASAAARVATLSKGFSLGIAWAFHPLGKAILDRVPEIIGGILRIVGISK